MNAGKEYSATTAEATTTTQEHAGSNKTIHRARPPSQIATDYHPTATLPPLMGATVATQPTEVHNNPLFNILDNNPPSTSTLMHTPQNGTSPAAPVDLIEGITQIMN